MDNQDAKMGSNIVFLHVWKLSDIDKVWEVCHTYFRFVVFFENLRFGILNFDIQKFGNVEVANLEVLYFEIIYLPSAFPPPCRRPQFANNSTDDPEKSMARNLKSRARGNKNKEAS